MCCVSVPHPGICSLPVLWVLTNLMPRGSADPGVEDISLSLHTIRALQQTTTPPATRMFKTDPSNVTIGLASCFNAKQREMIKFGVLWRVCIFRTYIEKFTA